MRLYFKLGLSTFLVTLLLTGCGPRSQEDFREEGEGLTRSLIQELQAIHTREQLLMASSRLQRLFDQLVNSMIAAEEFHALHPEQDKGELTQRNHDLSDQLRLELNRLYRLEGGRQMIEKCQENALHRLDACEKRRIKQVENQRDKR